MQKISVLGSTGSIGQSTLDVVRRNSHRFTVFALTAHSNISLFERQLLEFKPALAVLSSPEYCTRLQQFVRAQNLPCEILGGEQALCQVAAADEVDVVMAAIVGAAGLLPTLAAARAGKRILLANKESIVLAGALLVQAAAQAGATLIPIDSEHNAIFQCLPAGNRSLAEAGVRKIILTASGGPFRDFTAAQLADVTVEQACKHPNWSMGRKISVDSASMMNKGLEVIEAHWLFGASAEQIDVLVHRQSVIHSMVEYLDGSTLAQLGNPDMRVPIAHAMGLPERLDSGVAGLSLASVGRLDFCAPDIERFPCLALAYDALRAAGTAPAILNAANEVAVAAFLDRQIRFVDIAQIITATMEQIAIEPAADLEVLLDADCRSRSYARQTVAAVSSATSGASIGE